MGDTTATYGANVTLTVSENGLSVNDQTLTEIVKHTVPMHLGVQLVDLHIFRQRTFASTDIRVAISLNRTVRPQVLARMQNSILNELRMTFANLYADVRFVIEVAMVAAETRHEIIQLPPPGSCGWLAAVERVRRLNQPVDA